MLNYSVAELRLLLLISFVHPVSRQEGRRRKKTKLPLASSNVLRYFCTCFTTFPYFTERRAVGVGSTMTLAKQTMAFHPLTYSPEFTPLIVGRKTSDCHHKETSSSQGFDSSFPSPASPEGGSTKTKESSLSQAKTVDRNAGEPPVTSFCNCP